MAASTPRAAEAVNAVPEGRGVAIDLGGDSSALTYWASEGGSMHVVTTIDTVMHQDEPERHAVVRFASDLLPGQSQLISVPVAIGERQQVLRIRRLGDQIEVARIPAPAV
jgi:hypothetical protein